MYKRQGGHHSSYSGTPNKNSPYKAYMKERKAGGVTAQKSPTPGSSIVSEQVSTVKSREKPGREKASSGKSS